MQEALYAVLRETIAFPLINGGTTAFPRCTQLTLRSLSPLRQKRTLRSAKSRRLWRPAPLPFRWQQPGCGPHPAVVIPTFSFSATGELPIASKQSHETRTIPGLIVGLATDT